MSALSHWQAKKLAAREKAARKAERKAARGPAAITNHVPKSYHRHATVARHPRRIDPSLKWYILQTNIKCEVRAARGLLRKGIARYLPVDVMQVVRHGVKATVVKPTLARYLIVGLPVDNLAFGDIRATDGVESFLGVCGEPIAVPAAILQAFEDRLSRLASEAEEARSRSPFEVGQQIVIEEGNFAKFNAEVSRVFSAVSVEVVFDMLGRATRMEMPVEYLRAA